MKLKDGTVCVIREAGDIPWDAGYICTTGCTYPKMIVLSEKDRGKVFHNTPDHEIEAVLHHA